jgi:hypothetical protein
MWTYKLPQSSNSIRNNLFGSLCAYQPKGLARIPRPWTLLVQSKEEEKEAFQCSPEPFLAPTVELKL